jgi:hypothetical protein
MAGSGVKVGGLALVVAAVFGGAYGLGQLVGPVTVEPEAASHADMAEEGRDEAGVPKGLQTNQDGTTLEVLSAGATAGQPAVTG